MKLQNGNMINGRPVIKVVIIVSAYGALFESNIRFSAKYKETKLFK